MSVIRNRHNSKHPYVVIDKTTLWNEKLSLGAVGLWSRCISRPDNWLFSVNELEKRCVDSKYMIYKFIRELINVGICIRIQQRCVVKSDDKIHMGNGPVEYIFLEVPPSEEEKKEIIEEMEVNYVKGLMESGYQFTDTKNSVATRRFKKFLLHSKLWDATKWDAINSPITNNDCLANTDCQTNDDVVDNSKNGISEADQKNLKKKYPLEFEEGLKFLVMQEKTIENPVGWLTNCLKFGWHKKAKIKESHKQENLILAKKIISQYSSSLLPGSSFEMNDDEFTIIKGVKFLKFSFKDCKFKEKLYKEMKSMGLI